jgi:hypothetical protein
LAWRINELFAELVSKLDYRDEVTYAKSEAHGDIMDSCIISKLEGTL